MIEYLNPIAWLRWFGQFVAGWALSIPWRSVPRAIPALLLLVILVAGIIAARAGMSGWRNQLVNRKFIHAWQVDDFATAELLLRRQLASRPDDADLGFKLAVVQENRDEHEQALELMRRLVATRKHGPAARWLLEKEYLNQEWAKLDEDQRKEFGMLLQLLHEESPRDVAVTQLYAEYSIAQGNLNFAATLLEKLAPMQPMRGLQAAAIHRQLGNETSANRLATSALEQVDKLAQEDPTNGILWLAVAQNQLFLSRHADAVRTLERAIPRVKTSEQEVALRQGIGDALVAWISFIDKSSAGSPTEQLRILHLLQTALQYAPNNPRVLMMVSDQVLKSMNIEDGAVASTREALVQGTSPGIAHFIQGTAAMIQDDVEKANMHLTIAADLLPRSGAILNNLAVAMAARPGADLEQALKISQTAIDQTPGATPHFFETRGQILVKLERYLDAVPDLERALAVQELAVQAHESLAVCYRELGQEELSRQHAAMAARKGTGQAEP